MARYSEDLKERAVKYVESGNSYGSASRIFGATEVSLRSWHKRYLQFGHVRSKGYPGKTPRVSNEDFTFYVKDHPDQTLKEIGAHFGMTDAGALYYMRKTGMRYKKKSLAPEKRARRKDGNI